MLKICVFFFFFFFFFFFLILYGPDCVPISNALSGAESLIQTGATIHRKI